MLLVILVLQSVPKTLAELNTLISHLFLFFAIKLVTFSSITYVTPPFFDVAITKALLVNLFELA